MIKKALLSLSLVAASTFTNLANAVVLDVAFILDSSGSVGQNGWTQEKHFVRELVQNLDAQESADVEIRFGIINFSNTVNVAWDFNDAQDPLADILSAIDALPFLDNTTHTRSAVDVTLDMFANSSAQDTIKHAFLITDGNPYPYMRQNPCLTHGGSIANRANAQATRDNLAASGVDMTIIGVGSNWDPQVLDCLVNTPEDIVTAHSFDQDALDAIVPHVLNQVNVPEPATLPIMGLGLLLLALRNRRKA